MKPTRWFSAIFFFTSSIVLAGCYTHLATSNEGYYVYHAPRPVYSDTIRPRSSNASLAEKPLIKYDTTMHGDTMFIDEHRIEPAAQTASLAGGGTDGTTIINNYYGANSYWDSYWGPSWGVSIGFGWPYHSWYSPWWPYYSSWYEPYGYWGVYPPIYDCYAPFYSSYYPYYGGYYPYYGHGGYYRHGFHDHDFGDNFGGNPYNEFGRTVRSGRIGGEQRAGSTTLRTTQAGGIIGDPVNSNLPNASIHATNSSLAETNAADMLRASADRNAPMHVVGPDATAAAVSSQSSTVRTEEPANVGSDRSSVPVTSNGVATESARPVIVRRMEGQTVTTMTTAGRQMVVVHRAANYGSASRSYDHSGNVGSYGTARSNNNGSGSYNESGNSSRTERSSSNSSGTERSSSNSSGTERSNGESYSGGHSSDGGRGYSSGRAAPSGGESTRASGGESSGEGRASGGEAGRASGGGGGRAR